MTRIYSLRQDSDGLWSVWSGSSVIGLFRTREEAVTAFSPYIKFE